MFKQLTLFSFLFISLYSLSCNDDTTTLCGANDLHFNGLRGKVKSMQIEVVLTWNYRIAPNKLIDTVQTEGYQDFFNIEGYFIDRTYDGSQYTGQTTVTYNQDSTVMERISSNASDTSRLIHFYENCRIMQCREHGNNTYFKYDQDGNLIRKTVIGSMGDTLWTNMYTSSKGRIVKIETFYQTHLELTIYYKYDSQNCVIQMRIENNDGIELANENYKYSKNGQLKKTLSIRENDVIGVTKYSFDSKNNWIRSVTKDNLYGNKLVITRVISYY